MNSFLIQLTSYVERGGGKLFRKLRDMIWKLGIMVVFWIFKRAPLIFTPNGKQFVSVNKIKNVYIDNQCHCHFNLSFIFKLGVNLWLLVCVCMPDAHKYLLVHRKKNQKDPRGDVWKLLCTTKIYENFTMNLFSNIQRDQFEYQYVRWWLYPFMLKNIFWEHPWREKLKSPKFMIEPRY